MKHCIAAFFAALSYLLPAAACHAETGVGPQIAEQGNRALHEIRQTAARDMVDRLRAQIAPSALSAQLQQDALVVGRGDEVAPVPGPQRAL